MLKAKEVLTGTWDPRGSAWWVHFLEHTLACDHHVQGSKWCWGFPPWHRQASENGSGCDPRGLNIVVWGRNMSEHRKDNKIITFCDSGMSKWPQECRLFRSKWHLDANPKRRPLFLTAWPPRSSDIRVMSKDAGSRCVCVCCFCPRDSLEH